MNAHICATVLERCALLFAWREVVDAARAPATPSSRSTCVQSG